MGNYQTRKFSISLTIKGLFDENFQRNYQQANATFMERKTLAAPSTLNGTLLVVVCICFDSDCSLA